MKSLLIEITPPVESYTGATARATNLRPRLGRDKHQHSQQRIQGDLLESDFWPALLRLRHGYNFRLAVNHQQPSTPRERSEITRQS